MLFIGFNLNSHNGIINTIFKLYFLHAEAKLKLKLRCEWGIFSVVLSEGHYIADVFNICLSMAVRPQYSPSVKISFFFISACGLVVVQNSLFFFKIHCIQISVYLCKISN